MHKRGLGSVLNSSRNVSAHTLWISILTGPKRLFGLEVTTHRLSSIFELKCCSGIFMCTSSSRSCSVSDISIAAQAAPCSARCPSSNFCAYLQYGKLKKATNRTCISKQTGYISDCCSFYFNSGYVVFCMSYNKEIRKMLCQRILGLGKLIEMTPPAQIDAIANGLI